MQKLMQYLVAVLAAASGAYVLIALKNAQMGGALIFLAGLLSDWADAQKILDLWRGKQSGQP